MRPISFTYTPLQADTDGMANDVTAAAGTAFTLITDEMSDGLAHSIIITPSGSVTGNYTISGTNADGESISETLATDTTNAVTSANYYVSDIVILAPSGLGAETVDIGWTGVSVSPAFLLNWRQTNFQVSLGLSLSGTINVTVQHTFDNVRDVATSDWTWWPHTSLVTKTSSADGNYAFPVTATRILVNSTSGGSVTFFVDQGF